MRQLSASDRDFLDIPGVGSQKLADYGAVFMAEVGSWLASNPPQTFAHETEPPPAPKMKSEGGINSSALETLRLHRLGKSMDAIANARTRHVSRHHRAASCTGSAD